MTVSKQKVRYTKVTGESSERVIIVMNPPKIYPNISALDVTSMNEETQEVMTDVVTDYLDYVGQKRKQILSLEDWIDNSQIDVDHDSILHRQFKPSGLQYLSE